MITVRVHIRETDINIFPYKNIPTVDIYFRAPLEGLISESLWHSSNRPIRRLGPSSFFANGRAIIIRYATPGELNKIKQLKPERVYYLIDDDFSALVDDVSLPEDYRNRQLQFASDRLPDILDLTDSIVAPNPLIHRAYPDKTHLLLGPSLSSLATDFSHFDVIGKINLVFTGSRSHLADFALIADVVADICRHHGHVHFTSFLGEYVPDSLKGSANIINHKACSWPVFKRIMQTQRFHIALAPQLGTAFNRARSINKILDHGAFGAAGLYSARSPISGAIEHGVNGLLIDDQAESWRTAILGLIEDISQARKLAQAGCSLASKLGDPETVRNFWISELFGFDMPEQS